MPSIRPLVPAFALLAAAASAPAALTPLTGNGADLVYSSFSNVTWIQNANLLGDMIAARGLDAVFADISAVSPTVTYTFGFNGPAQHTLTTGDLSNDSNGLGRVNYFGANAFINYLNATNYGGTNTWRLPRASNGVYPNPVLSSYTKAGDLGQLYYDEWGAAAGTGAGVDPQNLFASEQSYWYWSYNPFVISPTYTVDQPFAFHLGRGDQYNLNENFGYYVLPVASGYIPEPATLTAAAAAGLLARRRRA